MSAAGLQSALFDLARFPAIQKVSWDHLIKRYSLTDGEIDRLKGINGDHFFIKFRQEQCIDRFKKFVWKPFPTCVNAVGYRKLFEIFKCRFEMTERNLSLGSIPGRFMRHIEDHFESLKDQFGLPEYFVDLCRYEFARFRITKRSELNWTPPAYSSLNPECPFFLIEFDYDVAKIRKEIASYPTVSYVPLPKKTNLILARISDQTKEFIVSDSIKEFVRAFLNGNSVSDVRPSAYRRLVEFGLLRDV